MMVYDLAIDAANLKVLRIFIGDQEVRALARRSKEEFSPAHTHYLSDTLTTIMSKRKKLDEKYLMILQPHFQKLTP